MAKISRRLNGADKVIQGIELDAYIKAELQAMVREGLEKSPIQPSTLHARLKAKGVINGGVSTLTPRRSIINEYKLRQHNNYEAGKRELTSEEKIILSEGRTGAAYISKSERLSEELDLLESKYQRNILAVADIIEYVDNSTALNVEDLLARDLIRELAKIKNEER
ncbi:hypothetical protein AB6D86_23495 [Vibrio splendidus]